MGAYWSQPSPRKPAFTEADVGPQNGRVFLVTGGTSGIGFELAKMLYRKAGRVWIAGRSPERGQQAMCRIRKAAVPAGGGLEFLLLRLDDLNSVREAADEFTLGEWRLDVLFLNAGVFLPPPGSVSAQGFELQLATNCLGPYLFAHMVALLLLEARLCSAPAAARIVWSSSEDAVRWSPPHGIVMDEIRHPPEDPVRSYVNSKTGNLFLACVFARWLGRTHGIASVSADPGAASTSLFRHTRFFKYLAWALLPGPELAANTLLYAGLSEDITIANSGCLVVPGPKIEDNMPPDLVDAMKPRADGGLGRADEFHSYCVVTTYRYRYGNSNEAI
ncbi:NAD(P)-binding protein [Hypoxylon cercidicola]|nr:NAD(P)-binding protein [Hypoxylon cercidicola]